MQKPKGKKKKYSSESPNWRNKEVPLPETTKITEEVLGEEPTRTMDMDVIKEHQETPATTTDTERTMETSEEESTEFTQAPINVLAQIEMDNSPLEELWINTKLLNYKDIFNQVTAERFLESWPWDHAIDLKEDFVPSYCKVYPMTLLEQAELDKFIDKNLAKGYIRPLKSPMALPFFFVSKKDGKLQPCQDYWKLNKGTIKNSYPLPLISTLLDKLKGAKYFTKLDLRSGYNVQIKDGDQWKAAFKTSRGLFEPMVMSFGLWNSLATFQQMMDAI